jgi:hypothetical protein
VLRTGFRAPSEATVKCGEGGKFVKRVIGLPGETVREDDHGFIWIRAPRSKTFDKLNEPYVPASRRLADSSPLRAGLASSARRSFRDAGSADDQRDQRADRDKLRERSTAELTLLSPREFRSSPGCDLGD